MTVSFLRPPREHTAITYGSPEGIAFADMTKPVYDAVSSSGIKEGFALIKNHSPGSALLIQEASQQVEKDILARLSSYAEQGSWPSLFQQYQALPIKEGQLKLGRYQSILAMLMNAEMTPSISVTPVEGKLESILIDTGKPICPVLYESEKSNYLERGSEKVFDITKLAERTARVSNDSYAENFSFSVGTSHTTCVLCHDMKGESIESIVNRMHVFAPLHLHPSAYHHNDLVKRVNVPEDERQNGRAHVVAAMLSPSLIFHSEIKGSLYLIELDGPRKKREINIAFSSSFE